MPWVTLQAPVLSPRMVFFVGLFEVHGFDLHVSVDELEAGVAQHPLEEDRVGAALKHVGGEGVVDGVAGQGRPGGHRPHVPAHKLAQAVFPEPFPFDADEERRFPLPLPPGASGPRQLRPRFFQIAAQQFTGSFRERGRAALAAFPPLDAKRPLGQGDVTDICCESHRL